jgi:hypothetical protein
MALRAGLPFVLGHKPRERITRIPKVLSNAKNLEFLSGLGGAFKMRIGSGLGSLAHSFEQALIGWVRDGGDYLALANADFADDSSRHLSLHVILTIQDDGRSIECHSRATETDERYSLPVGPKCVFSLQRSSDFTDRRWDQVVIPLAPLLSTSSDEDGRHVVYAHTFTNEKTRLSGVPVVARKTD